MKNLKIDRVTIFDDLNLKNAEEFTINQISGEIYIATPESLITVENNEISRVISWKAERGEQKIVSLTCRTDGNQVVAILADGRAVVVDGDDVAELEICQILDSTATSAEWSSDEQTLAIADNNNLFLTDSSLIQFFERPLQFSDDERRSGPVNVGWGSELTQFRGSAGKIKDGEKPESENEKIVQNSTKSVVHWRWDGEFVAVSHFSQTEKTRFMTIFDKNGEVMSSMNIRNIYLSDCFAHKPNANLICSAVLKNASSDELIFYERNGETRNGYSIKWNSEPQKRTIQNISWNSTGTILGLETKVVGEQEYLEFWRLSNYEFTRKYIWKVPELAKVVWRWSVIQDFKVHILISSGSSHETGKLFEIDLSATSSYSQALGLNIVTATDELRVSSLCRRAIPPPMCENAIQLDSDIVVYTTSVGKVHVLTTDGNIQVFSQLQNSPTKFEKTSETAVLPSEVINGVICGVSYLENTKSYVIWSNDTIWMVDDEGKNLKKLYSGPDIGWVGINPENFDVEVAISKTGEFLRILEGFEEKIVEIQPFESVQVFFVKGSRVLLTDDSSLFVDSVKVASNVTSILTRKSDVIFIDFDNKLKFVDVEEKKVANDIRDVEAGSELVACDDSANVVLQAARGNLETIQPRRFIMIQIRELLDSKKYIEAFKCMKKHRIDMSYALEYKENELEEDIDEWLKSPDDSQLLEQLVVSSTEKFGEEGNSLCQVVYDKICGFEVERKTKFFPLLLTSLLRTTPIRTNDALKAINEHVPKISDRKDVFTRQSLHHVSFFVPAKQLFNCSLSTYDLKLAQQVAEASNYDPKEYLPVLNKLNQIPCDMERKYRINVVREAWKEALEALFVLDSSNERGDDEQWWTDAKDMIQREGLHRDALKILNNGEKRYENCCELYAVELEKKIHWKEAALFYELAGNLEKTMKCWEMARDVDGLISTAKRCKIEGGKLKIHLLKMSAALKEARLMAEYGKALKLAGSASYQIVQAFCEGQEWRLAQLEMESLDLEDRAMKVLLEAARTRSEGIKMELERRSGEFDRYRKRLEIVRNSKLEKVEKFAAGEIEDFRDDVSQISSISSRSGSSKVSMASTIRRRKQIDKKKASLKEGGEYEDSALLNAIAEQYKWMENVRKEISQLIPVLMACGLMNEAFDLKSTSDEMADKLVKARMSIWPDNLPIQYLPGPLYSLFDANQEPSPIPMPPVFRIEPELVAPSSSFASVFP